LFRCREGKVQGVLYCVTNDTQKFCGEGEGGVLGGVREYHFLWNRVGGFLRGRGGYLLKSKGKRGEEGGEPIIQ